MRLMLVVRSAVILCAATLLVASTSVYAGPPVFRDGFECGFVYAWSSSLPAAPERLILSFPPASLASVSEVVPLGSVFPGSQHVIPVDHMYLGYLMPDGGGVSSVAVQAMAAGDVTMINRTVGADRTDYEIFIVHADGMTTQYDHLHDLSPTILDHVDGFWFEPMAGSGSEAVLLGQLGGPAPLAVAAGQAIGASRNFDRNWDVGFIDACRTTLPVNPSPRRYPDIPDLAAVLGLAFDATPGAVVDPHPVSVTAGAQVCYDLERTTHPDAWDRLFLEIQGDGSLRARFEVLGSGTPTCPTSPSIVWTGSDPTFIR